LIEVLVCLMLLSLLAAAVFPVVTRRAGGEESRRVAEDLSALGAAVDRFVSDLDGALPSDLEDLAARPDQGDGAMDSGGLVAYTEEQVRRWRGPYFAAPLTDGVALATGFDVPIQHDLVRFDGAANAPLADDDSGSAGKSIYLAVRLGRRGRELTAAQFEAINDLIDGQFERDGPGEGTSWSRGRFRYEPADGGVGGIGYYLTVPIER